MSLTAAADGITPPLREVQTRPSVTVRDAWLGSLGLLSDAARGVQAVREFMLRHYARFHDGAIDDWSTIVRDLAGYRDNKRGLWLFTEDGFKEACRGHDSREVCRELRRRGLLFTNENDRFTSKHNIPGVADRLRLYAVRSEILKVDDIE